MIYIVDRCADCPLYKPESEPSPAQYGNCRITNEIVTGVGNPPPTCPLRDSAVTIVIREGR